MPAFLLKNPLASGLGVLCLLLGLAFGWEYVTVQERNVTIAQKDTALAAMKAQQEANIAAAERKVRLAMQADIDKGNKLVAELQAQTAQRQEKENAAETAVAAAADVPTAAGCPEPMSLPVLRAFRGGLPDE